MLLLLHRHCLPAVDDPIDFADHRYYKSPVLKTAATSLIAACSGHCSFLRTRTYATSSGRIRLSRLGPVWGQGQFRSRVNLTRFRKILRLGLEEFRSAWIQPMVTAQQQSNPSLGPSQVMTWPMCPSLEDSGNWCHQWHHKMALADDINNATLAPHQLHVSTTSALHQCRTSATKQCVTTVSAPKGAE